MSKQLSNLQQNILTAARANGGLLTYKEAYALFISFTRPAAYRPNAIYFDRITKAPTADHLAEQRRFDAQAECIRHTMRRLVRRGLATFHFSQARLLRLAARQEENGYVRATKPSGICVTLPGNRTLKSIRNGTARMTSGKKAGA